MRTTLGGGASALEAVRKAGPEAQKAGAVTTVATLSALAPGTYAIFAKTILSPDTTDVVGHDGRAIVIRGRGTEPPALARSGVARPWTAPRALV